jgi:hypothetical protein
MRLVSRMILAAVAVLCAVVLTSASAGTISKGQLRSKLLTLADFPKGWVVAKSNPTDNETGCFSHASLSHVKRGNQHDLSAQKEFDAPAPISLPFVGETLHAGHGLGTSLTKVKDYVEGCKPFTMTVDGYRTHVVVKVLNVPSQGSYSASFALEYSIDETPFYVAFIQFETDHVACDLGVGGIGAPPISALGEIALGAKEKIDGIPISPVTTV